MDGSKAVKSNITIFCEINSHKPAILGYLGVATLRRVPGFWLIATYVHIYIHIYILIVGTINSKHDNDNDNNTSIWFF